MKEKPSPLAAYKWRSAQGDELWVMGLFKADGSVEWGIQVVPFDRPDRRATISGLSTKVFEEIQSAVARQVASRKKDPSDSESGA